MKFLALTILIILTAVLAFFYLNPEINCKLCGAYGNSNTIKEATENRTLVRVYPNFEILTDSLSYLELNNKQFFLEQTFKYGKRIATKIQLTSKDGYSFQSGISPAAGQHLKQQYRLIGGGYFNNEPDTINYEIWSYVQGSEKTKKLGEAIAY